MVSPQGPVPGPAQFNIFINDIDNVNECTLSKTAGDTKLCGAVNTLEGWDAIQRDLDKLEKQTHMILMRFNNSKCRIPYLGRGDSQSHYRLGDEGIESGPVGKDLEYWWMKSWM